MDMQSLGAWGELLGGIGGLVAAIGVILTLLYLARQIRQNTSATRANVAQSLADSVNSSNLLLAQDEGLARLYRIGKSSDRGALTEDERFRWDRVAIAVCRSLETVLTHDRLGQADAQSLALAKTTIKQLFGTEAYKQWWMEGHGGVPFTADFSAYVEEECLDP